MPSLTKWKVVPPGRDLGDVGSQVAQGLLAALDRVVLLGRLVAQLLGGELGVHFDPARRAVAREREDRLGESLPGAGYAQRP
jgi:hypothetical protein